MSNLETIGTGSVLWSRLAREDLRSVHDRLVRAELIDIAERELELGVPLSELEGPLVDYPKLFWRRAIRTYELESFRSYELDVEEYYYQSCDYVYIYRAITDDEKINYKRSTDAIAVLRLPHNRDLAKILPDRINLKPAAESPTTTGTTATGIVPSPQTGSPQEHAVVTTGEFECSSCGYTIGVDYLAVRTAGGIKLCTDCLSTSPV